MITTSVNPNKTIRSAAATADTPTVIDSAPFGRTAHRAQAADAVITDLLPHASPTWRSNLR